MTTQGIVAAQLDAAPARTPLWRSRRTIVLIFLFLATLLSIFDRSNIAVLIANPAFDRAFGLAGNPVAKGALASSFIVVYGLGSIFLGAVADWLGARRAMLWMVAIWSLAMGLTGFLASLTALMVFRGLLGLAEGPQFAIHSQFVKRWFPLDERARANALWNLGVPMGAAFGIPLTAMLTRSYGWHASFFVFGAAGLVLVVPLVLIFGWERPREARGVSAVEVADIEGGLQAEEARVQKPDWASNFRVLVRLPQFWILFVFTIANTGYLYGLITWLPSYLIQARHFSMARMGALASLPFIAQIIGLLLTGWVEDRVGRRAPVCLVAYIGTAVCMFLAVHSASGIASALLITAATFFYGASLPTVVTLAQDIVPRPVMATGVGISNGLGNFFSAAVPILMGAAIAASGNVGSGLLFLVGDALLGVAVLGVLTAYGY